MILAVTSRLDTLNNRDVYYINKSIQDVFDKLNIVLFPVSSLINIEDVVRVCDGLIITGGEDINPGLYNEEVCVDNIIIDKYADKLDFGLIKAFYGVKKPILGICRGMQVINVYFGGSLYQDMNGHKLLSGELHSIKIKKDTFMYECYKKNIIFVNSNHHQSIKRVADGFKVTAISDDGIIEAIEKNNIIGVEWHPEKLNDLKFFKKIMELFKNNS